MLLMIVKHQMPDWYYLVNNAAFRLVALAVIVHNLRVIYKELRDEA